MALSTLTSSDAGASARDKINAGLVEADKVSGLAAILAALQIQLAPYLDLVGGNPERPGDARTLFTGVMTGEPKSRLAFSKGTIAAGGDLGQVLRISGADVDPTPGYIDIAPRRAYFVRPGRAYLVHHAFARFQDPTDPLQNAVELRLQNLNGAFGQVSNVRLGSAYAPAVVDGAYFIDTFIGKAGAPGTPTYTIPNTATYCVPFFRVYGTGQQTDLGSIRMYDVSDALAGGADVASLVARVSILERSQSANVIYSNTWAGAAGLSSIAGKTVGGGAEVSDTDTGTHTDPVTGAANTPNAGRFAWSATPAGWRYVGVSTAQQAAAFLAANIPVVPLASAPSLRLAFLDPSTSRFALLSADDSAKFIQDIAVPRYYQFEVGDIVVSNESSVVLPADEFRRGEIEIQAITQCQLGVRFGGGLAVFGQSRTWLQSSDWLNHNGGQGSISIVARAKEGDAPTAPFSTLINIRVNRSINVAPNLLTTGDKIVGRMKDPMDPRFAAILKKEIDDAVALGDYGKFPGWWMVGATKENTRVNLGDPAGVLFNYREGASGTPIQIVPYRSLQGNAQDQNIDTLRMPASFGWADTSHMLGVRCASTTLLGGANPMIASNLINLQPNRTNGEHGFSSGASTDRTTVSGSNGKWIAMVRATASDHRDFVDETLAANPPRANPTVVARTVKLMSGAGVAGSSDYNPAPFAGAFTGPACTDAELIRHIQRCKRIEAVGALIASGA